MTMAVMGAGSLGIIVGALLARSGQDVVLIDADEKNVDALNTKGARIAGSLDITVPVRAVVPARMQGIYDIVILLTKQTYNEAALTALLPHLGPDSTVCTLQNGIPEESVAARVGIDPHDRRNGGLRSDLARTGRLGPHFVAGSPEELRIRYWRDRRPCDPETP